MIICILLKMNKVVFDLVIFRCQLTQSGRRYPAQPRRTKNGQARMSLSLFISLSFFFFSLTPPKWSCYCLSLFTMHSASPAAAAIFCDSSSSIFTDGREKKRYMGDNEAKKERPWSWKKGDETCPISEEERKEREMDLLQWVPWPNTRRRSVLSLLRG